MKRPAAERREQVRRVLERGPATLAELAAALGMAERHLRDHARAVATRVEQRPAPGRGRPTPVYWLQTEPVEPVSCETIQHDTA